MDVDTINLIIKGIWLSFCTVYIFFKIMNYKNKTIKNKIIVIFCVILCTAVYVILRQMVNVFSALFIFIIFQAVFLKFYIKEEFFNTFIIVIISNAVNLLFIMLCLFIVFIIGRQLGISNNIFRISVTCSLHAFMLIMLFKIKKFKYGFYFLRKQKSNEYLNIIIVDICAILLLLGCWIGSYYGTIEKQIFNSFIILVFLTFWVIGKTLKLSYKQKLIEQTLKDYEAQIKEKDEQLKKLDDEKYKISKLNHEFYNRQKALMLKVEDALANMNFESAEESGLKEKIQELSNEYTNKALENRVGSDLPKTDVEEIDDMFTYMQMECKKCGIEFILQVSGNINFLVNNYIEKSKLVTLIGDHLRDAIIAVNYSKNKYKSILAILGIKDDNYEFCIYDSGIEFEIETIDKLGIEPATTHKDDGGSGIGFITTFETLKETKASFILEELNECKEDSYTKAIKFIFDGKEMLKINSYRSNLLKKVLKTDRYEINNT